MRSSEFSVSPPIPPLISVVVPWIGRVDYISDTVSALLRQDYANLEILISDNSLSTALRQFLKNAADPRIRIITRSDRRLSSAEHFTACLRDAHGEYAMILSDDDLVEPQYVSGMFEAIRSHPATTAVLGEQIVIGKEYHQQPANHCTGQAVDHFDGKAFFFRRLLNPRALPIVTYVSVFARRADMLSFPYREYPDGSNSDNFMMLCLALQGDVSLSSRKMYYRVYEESAGLRTPFVKLLESCSRYERDAVDLVRGRLNFVHRISFRFLLRARNTSMMTRRLFHIYRKRMKIWELLAAGVGVIAYLCGRHQHARGP